MRKVCDACQREGLTMKKESGNQHERVRVKASGGIRTVGDVRRMVGAGAERIGASAGVAIVGGVGEGLGY